jgi:glyoxylase-like metal-dependent hydrolase (beta-lactamase superfamily II)
VRVVSLHPDVLVATSAIWQTNCTIVRGRGAGGGDDSTSAVAAQEPNPVVVRLAGDATAGDETFVIDSPILPDELEILPALLEQSRFPRPKGLLVTHADWDHLLGRIVFPDATLGCAASTAERMRLSPGEPQRELRASDERYYLQRSAPLALGSVQAIDVPGSCEIGSRELVLYDAAGHTADGMIVWIEWAGVLVCGDYLSAVEIPVLDKDGSLDAYVETLVRLRALVAEAQYVVSGHGPILSVERASSILDEDLAYVEGLRARQASAELPAGRRTREQRRLHSENVARLEA